MRASLIVFLVAVAGVAHADGAVRAKVREHQATRAELRARLQAASGPSEHASGTLYHQIRDPQARAEWAATLRHDSSQKTLRSWIPKGGYPGIWTIEDSDGFYRANSGKPFEIQLKPGAVLYDADKPEHRAVYEAWKKLDAKTRGEGAENRFDQMKSTDGRSLSSRVAAVHAPAQERFYREMGIAGVAYWHDSYGQRSVIVLNSHEIASVKSPSE